MNKSFYEKSQYLSTSQLENVIKLDSYAQSKSSSSPRRLDKSNSSRRSKRSSSESNVRSDSELNDSYTSTLLFKSKSTRNIKEGKLIKSYVKNQNSIKIYESVPSQHMPPLHITNQDEVKKKFIEFKIPPVLQFKADNRAIQNILTKHNKTSFQHFFKAKNILDTIKSKYSDLVSYYEANFGKKISSNDCVDIIGRYLIENKINGDLTISFAPGLTCSGRITSYMQNKNDPSSRKFQIWINDGEDNQFLRKKGIISLCDHEIGTHYYRAFNDGLQCWFTDRKKFGLRQLNTNELLRTEEGIAALHTLMNANLKFLFLPALLYYLACMADTMTFEQLYNHMEKYIEIPEERWKLVTRVKRGISDPYQTGCYSRDQSYFEGAIEILENIDNIDFVLLMSGKICLDELERVKRISRTNSIKLPKFMRDLRTYKDRLRQIGIINGIIESKDKENSQLNTKLSDYDLDDKYNKMSKVDLKESTELYNLNFKNRNLTSIEIKRFINREIVSHTKTTLEQKPKIADNTNSSLCCIL